MINKIEVVQKATAAELSKEVTKLLGFSYTLIGEPFSLENIACQMVMKNDGQVVTGREYKLVERYSSTPMTTYLQEYLNDGWELFGSPYELSKNPVQAVIKGEVPIISGSGSGGSGGTPEDVPKLKIRVLPASTAAATINIDHKDTLLIFNNAKVTLTLGSGIPANEADAFTAMAINVGGNIELSGTGINAYANQADKNVTIGLIRITGGWVVTGTNVPGELA